MRGASGKAPMVFFSDPVRLQPSETSLSPTVFVLPINFTISVQEPSPLGSLGEPLI